MCVYVHKQAAVDDAINQLKNFKIDLEQKLKVRCAATVKGDGWVEDESDLLFFLLLLLCIDEVCGGLNA